MNQLHAKGMFHEAKGKLEQVLGDLTDEDLLSTSIEDLTQRISRRNGKPSAEVKASITKVMDGLKNSSNVVNEKIHNIADRATEYVEQAANYAEKGQKKLEETAESIKQQSEDWVKTAESYMRQKPMTTLAIALGVGAVLGMIISK